MTDLHTSEAVTGTGNRSRPRAALPALVRPSFVPPEPIRRLRDLTHYRTGVIRERTREAQRPEKLLGGAGIKLSAAVSDILGSPAAPC